MGLGFSFKVLPKQEQHNVLMVRRTRFFAFACGFPRTRFNNQSVHVRSASLSNTFVKKALGAMLAMDRVRSLKPMGGGMIDSEKSTV